MKFISIILFLLLSATALSRGPIELDTKKTSIKSFSLDEVCKLHGLKHILLAEPVGTGAVDCMGTNVSITDFCKKKFSGSSTLLRGFINYEKMATCHFAESMILSLGCTRFPKYCKMPKHGCKSLKDIYAVSHKLTHSGLASRDDGDYLKCYFSNNLLELE